MMKPRSSGLVGLAPAFMVLLGLGLLACGSSSESTGPTSTAAATSGGTSTTGAGGAGGSGDSGSTSSASGSGGGAPSKSAACASTFGTELTSAFGRLDGVVTAVVKPIDQQCPGVNGDHVVIEAKMNGATYRLVINIKSDIGDPDVLYLALDHALPPPAWSEGWHTGFKSDYVATFGVHVGDFKAHPLAELADIVADAIPLGQKISVYAESSGGASAHKVHRNTGVTDGAIVLDPEGALPNVLLFHFANQSF